MNVLVEHESRAWTSPFFIELELVMEQLSLIDTGVKDLMAQDDMTDDPSQDGIDREKMLRSLRATLKAGVQACKLWFMESEVGDANYKFPVMFDVSKEAVSFHIPIHRFVAFFVSQVGAASPLGPVLTSSGQICRYSDRPLKEVLDIEDLNSFMSKFIEHPLRIQVCSYRSPLISQLTRRLLLPSRSCWLRSELVCGDGTGRTCTGEDGSTDRTTSTTSASTSTSSSFSARPHSLTPTSCSPSSWIVSG